MVATDLWSASFYRRLTFLSYLFLIVFGEFARFQSSSLLQWIYVKLSTLRKTDKKVSTLDFESGKRSKFALDVLLKVQLITVPACRTKGGRVPPIS